MIFSKIIPTVLFALFISLSVVAQENTSVWERVEVATAAANYRNVIAGDFTGDGVPDLIANAGRVTKLYVAPDWNEIVLEADRKIDCIHSEAMDVDGDGDLDWIGAQYKPGWIFWLEQPDEPTTQRWKYHLIDDQVIGTHGLLVGDVDQKGKLDLLANSGQPGGEFPYSLVWYEVPKNPRKAKQWIRHVFAKGDAPGLSHYLGVGDINGDGRPDAASGAKGWKDDSFGIGEWFAWWEAPKDPTGVWKKHMVSDKQPGATNIHPVDVNGDGQVDLLASRGHGQGIIWFEAPSWKEHVINPDLVGPHCLVVADMDNDGDIDAVTCAKDTKVAAWFENDGHGNFKTHVINTNQAAYDIRVLDMDNDDDLDVIIAGQASQNLVWYRNPAK